MAAANRRWLASALGLVAAAAPAADPAVGFTAGPDRLAVRVGGRLFAEYVFADPKIKRPYFARLHAPDGTPVTRPLPPVAGTDRTDHADMHPGVWLGFGDLGGADFWRNKAAVEHVAFAEPPTAAGDTLRFAVANRYVAAGVTKATEATAYRVTAGPAGTLLTADARFRAGDGPVAFGDQEEMGFGVRFATPLSVAGGGALTDSAGRAGEKQMWGKTTDWVDARRGAVGLAVMAHPDNFRPAWGHARDYGLVVLNPFGRKAFTGGPPSRVEVKPGEELRLRFAVLAYAGTPDVARAFADYVAAADGDRRRSAEP